MNRTKEEKGFIALISVLIIESVILVIVAGLSMRSISETGVSMSEHHSHRALALANLCAETALLKLESVLNYAGSESVIVGSDSCNIAAISGSGNMNRTVETSSTISGHIRRAQVQVAVISPVMQITSWTEI